MKSSVHTEMTSSSRTLSTTSLNSIAEGVAHDNDKVVVAGDKEAEKVRFSSIEIREYLFNIGDNPSVTLGVPLSISWECVGESKLSIDEYEKGFEGAPRRSYAELRIPRVEREKILRDLHGYTKNDILSMTRPVNISRMRRRRTIETMPLAPIEEAIEKAKRGIVNFTVRRKKHAQERALLKHFRSPVIPQKLIL